MKGRRKDVGYKLLKYAVMEALISLFSVMLVFGICFLLWLNSKAGKKWMENQKTRKGEGPYSLQ